jgi:hypothetical protein
VAAFTLVSYTSLQPGPSDLTNALLVQISEQLSSPSIKTSDSPLIQAVDTFQPSASALRVNILWFISLVLCLTCALAATLIQQWVRAYMRAAEHISVPQRRGHIRAFVFEGLQSFHVSAALEAIPALLHLSVFFFFGGLVEFLLQIDTTLAIALTAVISAVLVLYAILTVLPILYIDCPFQTPFTKTIWRLTQLALALFEVLRCYVSSCFLRLSKDATQLAPWCHTHIFREVVDKYVVRLVDGMEKLQELSAWSDHEVAVGIECRALQRTLKLLDREDEVELFIESIPGFLHSLDARDPNTVVVYLLDQKLLGSRLSMLLRSCVGTRMHTSHESRQRRALTCLRTVWHLTERLGAEWLNRWTTVQSELRIYTSLRDDHDPTVVANTLCTTALAAHGFLSALKEDKLRFTLPDTDILEDIVDIVTTLIGPSPALKEECTTKQDIIYNGLLVNLITFVLRLLPLLQAEFLPETDLVLAWDTLRILSNINCHEASLNTQVSFLRLCTEEMSDIWDDDVTLDMEHERFQLGDTSAGHTASSDVASLADVLLPMCSLLPQEVHDTFKLERVCRTPSPISPHGWSEEEESY